jgi:site-specific recombinase XerD
LASKNKQKMKRQIPASWTDALESFLFWKQAQGLAPRTLEDYRKHVTQFFTRYPQAYQEENLRKSIQEYIAQTVKPATFNLRLVYLKAFFSWCLAETIFSFNPLSGFKRKKDGGRIVNIDSDVLKKLIALPDRDTFSGLRDYTLPLLTLDTGIRPSEALSLKV